VIGTLDYGHLSIESITVASFLLSQLNQNLEFYWIKQVHCMLNLQF